MSINVLRAAALSAVVAATSPVVASAAPVRLSPSGVLDATSDGRYLLLADGSVLNRQTGAPALAADPDENLDLAASSPISMQRSRDGYVSVRIPLGDGRETDRLGSVAPDASTALKASAAVLVRDGSTVIFSTPAPNPRIYEYDVNTNSGALLMTNATLLDASEDGQVITFSRDLAPIDRPGAAILGDPSVPIQSTAVGYQVAGSAPRLIDQTRLSQQPSGPVENGCPTGVSTEITQPTDLQVSQDGAAGRYVLSEISTSSSKGGALFTTRFTRFGAGGAVMLARTIPETAGEAKFTTDPVSGAWAANVGARAASGFSSSATVTADDGRLTALRSVPGGTPDTVAIKYLNVVPFSRGSGAASGVQVYKMPPFGPSTEYGGAWVDDALGAVGASTTPWTTLPRDGDRVLPELLSSDQTWVTCAGVPGTAADYAAIQVSTVGNSAGTITVRRTPYGKVPAKRVSAKVSWYGLPIWTRAATADASLRLPGLITGLPGYQLAVTITLTDGTVLTESAALRRTR